MSKKPVVMVITPNEAVEDEHKWLESMFKHGLKYLHIRKQDLTEAQMIAYIEAIPQRYHSRIILHSHRHLLKRYKLKGVHFTETERLGNPLHWFRLRMLKLCNKDIVISTSTHELTDFDKVSKLYTYLFFSPVFESISKKGHKPRYGKRKMYEAVRGTKRRIVALGGVDTLNIPMTKEIEFYGVAVLGSVWSAENPLEKFKEIRDACQKSEKPFS